jgi:hypothetical protein
MWELAEFLRLGWRFLMVYCPIVHAFLLVELVAGSHVMDSTA